MPLHLVTDPRAYRGGRQQPLGALLRLMVVAFASGKRTLRAVENLAHDMTWRMRRAIGLRVFGVSDTTLYEALHRALPFRFWRVLVAQVKTDLDKKAIQNDQFAGGVVAYDGKKVAFGYGRCPHPSCLQTFVEPDNRRAWMLKSLRASLVSSSVRPALNQTFLDHEYGEANAFPILLEQDVTNFPRLFRYVTGDAGITSRDNAKRVRSYRKHYLFAVKQNSPMLYDATLTTLATMPVTKTTCERYRGGIMTRALVRAEAPVIAGFADATQVVSIAQTHVHDGGKVTSETRYFVTSVPWDELSDSQFLKLVRLHWQIENGPNWTCDVVLEEDDGCPVNVQFGPIVVSWLRLLTYNLIAVFRLQLSAGKREKAAWKRVCELIYQALFTWEPAKVFFANRV